VGGLLGYALGKLVHRVNLHWANLYWVKDRRPAVSIGSWVANGVPPKCFCSPTKHSGELKFGTNAPKVCTYKSCKIKTVCVNIFLTPCNFLKATCGQIVAITWVKWNVQTFHLDFSTPHSKNLCYDPENTCVLTFRILRNFASLLGPPIVATRMGPHSIPQAHWSLLYSHELRIKSQLSKSLKL